MTSGEMLSARRLIVVGSEYSSSEGKWRNPFRVVEGTSVERTEACTAKVQILFTHYVNSTAVRYDGVPISFDHLTEGWAN